MWGTPTVQGPAREGAHTGHGAAPARFRDVRVGVNQVSSVLFGERELRTIADRAMRAAKGDQTEALVIGKTVSLTRSRTRPSIRK